MGSAIPMPDPASQQYLNNAREEAASSLRGTMPDAMLAPLGPSVGSKTTVKTASPQAQGIPAPPASDQAQPPTPMPEQSEPPPQQNFGQDAAEQNTKMGALGESAAGLGSETGNAFMRGMLHLARGVGFAAVAGHDMLSSQDAANTQDVDDKIFDFLKNYVGEQQDKFWTPEGDRNKIQQAAGNLVEGFAGAPAQPFEVGQAAIDRNDSVTTAATLAAISATTNALMMFAPEVKGLAPGMKLGKGFAIPGMKAPNIAKRIASWVGLGGALDTTTNALTRYVLNNEAYQKAVRNYAAADRDPNVLPQPSVTGTEYADADRDDAAATPELFNPGDEAQSALMQVIFGVLHEPKAMKIIKNAEPPKASDSAKPPEAPATPPPPSDDAAPPVAGADANSNMPAPPPTAAATAPLVPENAPRKPVAKTPAPVENASAVAAAPAAEQTKAEPSKEGSGSATAQPPPRATAELSPTDSGNQAALDKSAAEATPADSSTTPKFAEGDRRVVKIAGEEVPVVVAGPSVDGNVPVKLIDNDGRIAKVKQIVPEHLFVEPEVKAAPVEAEPVGKPTEASDKANSDSQTPAPAETSGSTFESIRDKAGNFKPAELRGELKPVESKPLSPDEQADVEAAKAKIAAEPIAIKEAPKVEEQPTPENAPQVSTKYKPGDPLYEKDRVARDDMRAKQRRNRAARSNDLGSSTSVMGEDYDRAVRAAEREALGPEPAASPLQQALDTHELSQTKPMSNDRAGLRDRAFATGELARAVEAEAKSNKDIPENIRTEALAVAKQSNKIDFKSDEDFKKARGVSHKALDIHDENLRRVANNILHPEKADVRPEPVNVKAEKLKEKAARDKRSSPEGESAAGAESKPKVSTAEAGGSKTPKSFEARVKEALKTPGDALTKKERVEKILGKDWHDDWEAHQGDPIRAARLRDKAEAPVASGIADVEDATKLKTPSKGEQVKISKATSDYLNSGVDAAPVFHDKLEAVLRDIFGDHHVDHINNMMEIVRAQREDMREQAQERGRPKKMSDEVGEDEVGGYRGFDYRSDPGGDILEDKDAGAHRKFDPDTYKGRSAQVWKDLHAKLGSLWDSFIKAAEHNSFKETPSRNFKAKDILGYMLTKVDRNTPVHGLLTKLLQHMPDDVRIYPVRSISGYESARGIYNPRSNSIHIRTNESEITGVNTRTILHEMIHAVTSRFLNLNPDHPLAVEMNRLLDIAKQRALQVRAEVRGNNGLQLGDSLALPLTELPTHGDFYGLTNAAELMAEAHVNPDFQRMMLRSEKFASMVEGLRNVMKQWTRKVAEMLGLKDPRATGLLENIHDVTERVMQAQTDVMDGRLPEDARDLQEIHDTFGPNAGRDLMDRVMVNLDKDVPLPNEDEFRRASSKTGTDFAGKFRRAVRSGAIGTVRDANRGFISHSQLVRAALRRSVFGAHDETNPVRQWDEALQQRNASIDKVVHGIEGLVNDRMRLSYDDNKKLGQFQIDSTITGIDPTLAKEDQVSRAQKLPKFDALHDEMAARWKNLTDKQRDIYIRERDANERAARANRKAGIDLALDSYAGDKQITDATRKLLYSVDQPWQYADLIGGKNSVLDLGVKENEKLITAMQDLAGLHQIEGPYFHLGRNGDIVVHANPEGTNTYKTQAEAERFAQNVRDLSPGSKASVDKVGDSWEVDYKAEYTSMHETEEQAHQDMERMRKLGFDMGNSATAKLNSEETSGALTHGIATLVADAKTKLARGGSDEASEEAIKALRNSFVQLVAAHSSYAGSRLARKAIGGVKAEEMGRNFAKHIQSTAWNTGHMAHAFKVGEALGKIREAVKDNSVAPEVAYQRGAFYREISRRMALDNQTYGSQPAMNSAMAKLGFWNYMASFGHAMIYLTQNFSTTGFVAMSRWGTYKGFSSLNAAMLHVMGPSFRETYRALGMKKDASAMIDGIMAGVRKSERFGKWAQGENSPLQQLIDRGAIHSSLSNQLAETARGGNTSAGGRIYNRVQDYARIIPSMADMFNRVSTGLAALELTKGDVYKAADFIKETHMDYTASEKPRFFKQLSRVPGGNSVTMFHTYTQGMAHLLYSHVMDGVGGLNPEGRGEALKTVAGLMLGATLFAGIGRGMGLEPIRALRYTYNKLAGDSDEYSTFDTMTQDFIKSIAGEGDVADMMNHGILANHFTNTDISYRMGLSDLFFHNQPDVLSMQDSDWLNLSKGLLGPSFEYMMDAYKGLQKAFTTGDISTVSRAIPLKFVRDIMNGTPSGLASNDVRKAQENLSTDIEYSKQAKARQQALIQKYINATNKGPVIVEMAKFSQANPSFRINANKIRQEYKYQQLDAQQKAGMPGRDPVRNRLNDH